MDQGICQMKLKKSQVYPSSSKPKWQHLFNLNFVSGGKVVEVILSNEIPSVVRAEKNKLERTDHYKYGRLVMVSANAKDQVNP